MNVGYLKYLESDHWKNLRSRALIKAGHQCELCHHPRRLEVHHLMYRRLFDVTLDDLIVLCAACHSRAHYWITWGDIGNGETSPQRRHDLIVRFSGQMNRCQEVRQRTEPKARRPKRAPDAAPDGDPYIKFAKLCRLDVSHLEYSGNGVWRTRGIQ